MASYFTSSVVFSRAEGECKYSLNEEAGYKRIVNWPIFRDSLALGNGDNY